jgi:quercetin dioxygenase-like cupin family protein
MEFLAPDTFKRLSNPGVESVQILSPHNSTSSRVTITSVTVAPGAEQPRHYHEASEQIWIAVKGNGTLLLKDMSTRSFE